MAVTWAFMAGDIDDSAIAVKAHGTAIKAHDGAMTVSNNVLCCPHRSRQLVHTPGW